jgi:myo-inositol-1(or 4)-monophosphatase
LTVPLLPTLSQVETYARAAGKLLLSRFGQPHEIKYKGAVDLVTEADYLSEQYLLRAISADFPDHRVVTEEAGSNQLDSQHVWYLDPLDGTVNYAHGIACFAVSIAYTLNGVLEIGVVYDPVRDECFRAERGKGAWLNSQPIRVSQTAEVIQALLATGFPYEKDEQLTRNLRHHNHFAIHSRGVRRFGSAALDLCYVACGRFDGYWELVVNPWDVAAGSLIASEAGALVTNADGDQLELKMGATILAANPRLHELLLRGLHAVE